MFDNIYTYNSLLKENERNDDSIDALQYALLEQQKFLRRQLVENELRKVQPIRVDWNSCGPIGLPCAPVKRTEKTIDIDKIVVNEKNGYTIVKFADGSVSKVKCNEENFDSEKAIAMAICKYIYGNNRLYKAMNNATIIKKEEK